MRKKSILFLVMVFVAFLKCEIANALGFLEEFDVKIGVFDAATATLSYEANDKKYNIKARAKTENFFDTLYPFVGEYSSLGKYDLGELIPKAYDAKSKSRRHTRTKKIFYDDKGVPYKRMSSKDGKNKEVNIENVPLDVKSAELQTVLAMLFAKFHATRNCDLRQEVYDGKKHYLAIAKNVGIENRFVDFLNKTMDTYRCSIYFENLSDDDNILCTLNKDNPLNIWLTNENTANLPMVVEIRIDSTLLGALQITPKSFTIK